MQSGTLTTTDSVIIQHGAQGQIVRYEFADGSVLAHEEALGRQGGTRLLGTGGNDRITGTTQADDLRGYGGNDILQRRDGTDVRDGGAGKDVLDGRGLETIIQRGSSGTDASRGKLDGGLGEYPDVV